jgi:Uri superfamily endonuclease
MDLKLVYAHVLKEDCTIDGNALKAGAFVYIGSGSESRVRSRCNRSEAHLSLWSKLDFLVLKKNLTLDEARIEEQRLISEFSDSYLLNKKLKVDVVKTYTYKYLSSLFYYDEDHNLRHSVDKADKMGRVRIKKGQQAGYFQKSGYGLVSINRVNFTIHRILWCLYTKKDAPAGLVVDHIDRNPSNNRPENLRLVSHRDNQVNKSSKKTHKHITFYENTGRFLVQVSTSKHKVERVNIYGLKTLIRKGTPYEEAYKLKLKEALDVREILLARVT